MLQWDDLRFVLALGRAGSLVGAGRLLGVNHSTVQRRLGQMEARLGVRLFERGVEGCTPTAMGEDALALAERLDGEIDGLARRLHGQDTRLTGTLRVTTTDTLLAGALDGVLAAFSRRHPGIDLDLVVDNRFLSLSKRDADVALRPSRDPPETLVGRRICTIASAVYGPAQDIEAEGHDPDASGWSWIVPDDSLAHLPAARAPYASVAHVRAGVRVNTLMGMLAATRAGMGLAALPCFLADPDPALRRVRPPDPSLSSELWLLTHRDLRKVARVRAFLDVAERELRAMQDLFEGRGAAGKVERTR